jgi:RHS repeat-associated protein
MWVYMPNLLYSVSCKYVGRPLTAPPTYDYSVQGELLKVQLPDKRIISYDHDPLGRRIAKRIDGVIVEKYLWQGLTKLLAVYDGADNLKQRFEYADGRMPASMTAEGVRYFLAYDQVGSLRLVADGSGNMVKRIDYDAFGNIVNDSNPAMRIPFGFAGGLHDRDIGLVRFGYRDYDPDTGRWTAKDPIGFAGGDTDLYGYVQNNPMNYIDSNGLFRFGKRPLSGLPWIPGASANPVDDYFNTELSHEHGFFEDGTNDNIGFGPNGPFSENPTGKGYRYDNKHYDDAIMREALKNVKNGQYSLIGNLHLRKNNCQDWADRLRAEYEKILKKRQANTACP